MTSIWDPPSQQSPRPLFRFCATTLHRKTKNNNSILTHIKKKQQREYILNQFGLYCQNWARYCEQCPQEYGGYNELLNISKQHQHSTNVSRENFPTEIQIKFWINQLLNCFMSAISPTILQKSFFISWPLLIVALPHNTWYSFAITSITAQTNRYEPMPRHADGKMLNPIAIDDRDSTVT